MTPELPRVPREIPEFDVVYDEQAGIWRGKHRYSQEEITSASFDTLEILAVVKRTVVTLRRAAKELGELDG